MGRKARNTEVQVPLGGQFIKSILKRSIKETRPPEFIPTGILPFDGIIGGIPVGHITLIGGMPGSGKTLFCLKLAATCLGEGGTVIYADTEGSLTPQRLNAVGIPEDLIDERFFIERYIMLEDCLTDIKNLLIRLASDHEAAPQGKILIILDSLSSLLPTKWEEATTGEKGLISDAPIGVFARVGSIFLAGLPNLLQQANAALVITTQMRADIGAAGRSAPFKMFKFYALEHLSHLIIQLYSPEAFTPPFISLAESGDEDKIVNLKGAYHKVRIGFRKIQIFAHPVAVPPHLDISFFYPIVDIPQLSQRAGNVDEIYHVLVYGTLTGVLTKEIKPGIGTVFYFPVEEEKVLRFTYLDAYKKKKLRSLLETEVANLVKQKISELLLPTPKGKEVFKEDETAEGEIEEMVGTEEGEEHI